MRLRSTEVGLTSREMRTLLTFMSAQLYYEASDVFNIIGSPGIVGVINAAPYLMCMFSCWWVGGSPHLHPYLECPLSRLYFLPDLDLLDMLG